MLGDSSVLCFYFVCLFVVDFFGQFVCTRFISIYKKKYFKKHSRSFDPFYLCRSSEIVISPVHGAPTSDIYIARTLENDVFRYVMQPLNISHGNVFSVKLTFRA